MSMQYPPEHSALFIKIYIKSVLFGLDQVNCQCYIEVIRKKVFYCTIRSG